jgi:hypothetical protein
LWLQAKASKVYQHNLTACVAFGEIFEYSLDDVDGLAADIHSDPVLKLECLGKGIFAPCYGHAQAPLGRLHSSFINVTSAAAFTDLDVKTHVFPLGVSSSAANVITDNVIVNGISTVTSSTTTAISSIFSSAFTSDQPTIQYTSSVNGELPATVRLMSVLIQGSAEDVAKCREKLMEKAKEAVLDTTQVLVVA